MKFVKKGVKMINNEDIKLIEENIKEMAIENNWNVTENISKIAKAKCRMFGVENWKKCPCYPKEDNEHGCGTEACSAMIKNDGICHCHLYERK